jgi:hypothetical protein
VLATVFSDRVSLVTVLKPMSSTILKTNWREISMPDSAVAATTGLEDKLESLAKTLFHDPRMRSVGIGGTGSEPCFVAARNSAIILPQVTPNKFNLESFGSLPVVYLDTRGEIDSYSTVPVIRPQASNVIEQQSQRPL